ncbi:MAG: leucine-rich repeat protein, partial [Muribaculaceae bacterium]|nr:leucine-rich repeat protein [Muribaculaceae bacterium]
CNGLNKAEFSSIEHLCSIKFKDPNANPLSCAHNLFINGEEVKDLVIPETVTSIGSYAFSGCSGLSSVTIPNSVTSIDSGAFYHCSGLSSVTIPNSVTSISGRVFEGCSGLSSVTIPNSVTSIDYFVFYGCSGLSSVTIPNSVTSIGDHVFEGCSGLSSVTIPNSVKSIGSSAFKGCTGLSSVTIPNSVETIHPSAFYGCSGLSSVTIGNSVSFIGRYAFEGCSGLKEIKTLALVPPIIYDNSSFDNLYDTAILEIEKPSIIAYLGSHWSLFKNILLSGQDEILRLTTYNDGVLNYTLLPASAENDEGIATVISGDYSGEITIPERFTYSDSQRYYVKGIGYKAFENSKITSVSLNSRSRLEIIGDYAFFNCSELESVVLPNSVNTICSIGRYAFKGCSGLSSVTIGSSVESIGQLAFYDCNGLNKAEFSSIEHLCSIEFYGSSSNPLCYAHNLYINGEEVKDLVIPETVISIGAYAFEGCSGLSSVTIGSSVESIGAYAFEGCNGLNKAEFSSIEHLCSIKFGGHYDNPLYYAHNLFINGEEVKDLVIPETVTSIGSSAFKGCSGLSSVTIPNSVTSIDSGAFYHCSGLSSLTIPNSVESIGSSAFEGCSGLSSVTIPNSVTSISGSAFYGCSGLSSVTIGNSVESIGELAFEGCTRLSSLSLADGTIPFKDDNNNFAYMNLKSVHVGRPLATQLFNLDDLETLSIGNTTTEIAPSMWSDASKLTSLTLGNNLTVIGNNAFKGCTSLREVIVPPSVETIGASAFAGTNLASIIMGHNVKTIGEKAFNGCPAYTVSITAQTPPTAPNNTFSNYSGKLYLQGEDVMDAYYDAWNCWDRFDSYLLIEPTKIEYSGEKNLLGKPGETFLLTATLMPENVTLPQMFWRSTDPRIATVDANGLVTIHADVTEPMTLADEGEETETPRCEIIAESLYANGPVLKVTVSPVTTDMDEVFGDRVLTGAIDFTATVEVYNLNGMLVATSAEDLAPGIYIVRQGYAVKKISVK